MPSALRPTRRRVLIGAAVLAVIVAAALLIFGGGYDNTPYGYMTPQGGGTADRRPQIHRFGETVRLKTSRTTIEVTPTGYARQPATGTSGPVIGVSLTVKNVGGDRYLDQPSQAASVVFRSGNDANRLYDPVGSCRSVPPDTVDMGPGEVGRWCTPFELSGRPNLFIYAPEVGLPEQNGAPQAAAWQLGTPAGGGR